VTGNRVKGTHERQLDEHNDDIRTDHAEITGMPTYVLGKGAGNSLANTSSPIPRAAIIPKRR